MLHIKMISLMITSQLNTIQKIETEAVLSKDKGFHLERKAQKIKNKLVILIWAKIYLN